ncbi:nitroreductase family protein [Cooperia oncophora]
MPFMHEREMLRASQYFYEQMRLRRSVRSFSNKAVPLKIVQNIIKTAGCSPSVGNAQPWKFCVVVNEQRKAEIRALVEADARDNYILYHMPFMHEREMLRASQYFYEQMRLRRSVRSFSNKAVPLKIVQNIIKTAGCSPSVGNAQPWKFCVVVNEQRKAEIRALVEADARDNYVRRCV